MDYFTTRYLTAFEEESRYPTTFRFSSEIKDVFETPFLPIQDFLLFVDYSSVLEIQIIDYRYSCQLHINKKV